MDLPARNVAADRSVFARHSLLVLCLIGLLAHGVTLTFTSLTYFDDYYFILENAEFNRDLSNVVEAFRKDVFHIHQGGSYYRPLLTLTWMLDAQISGTDTWMYRITNLLLHLGATLLFFRVLLTIGFPELRSLVLSAVFVVHPILAQAVAWIPGRNDSLVAIFLLASFLFIVRYLHSMKVGHLIAHLAILFCAFLTKETSLLFPFLILAYLVVTETHQPWLRTAVIVSGWLMVFAVWRSLRMAAAITSGMGSFPSIAESLHVFIAHFGKVVWPFSQSVKYATEDLSVIPGIVGLVLVVFLVLASPKVHWKKLSFGALWFVFLLAPTFTWHLANAFKLKFFEHRLYLPLMGFLMLLGALELPRWQWSERIRPWLTSVLILILFVVNIQHSLTFRNGLTFWENAARTSPNDKTNRNLISMMELPAILSQRIDPDRSDQLDPNKLVMLEREFSQRLSDERDEETLQSLAAVAFGLGYLKTAEQLLVEATQLAPQHPVIHYNLGVLYYRAGLLDRAEGSWQETVEMNPGYVKALNNLCYLYYRLGKYVEATDACNRSVRLGGEVSQELLAELKQKTAGASLTR